MIELFLKRCIFNKMLRVMIQIPQPCSKKWENLSGDDQQRFCSLCQKNVTNIDSCTTKEVEGLPKNSCVRISSSKLKLNNSTSLFSTKFKFSIVALFAFTLSAFGQENNVKIKGKHLDANDFPIADALIKLKDTDQVVYTDENGNFEMTLPNSIFPFTLIYSDYKNIEHEVILDKTKLDQPIELKLEKGEDEDFIIGEIDYKPTFKRKVINTITWPYRKIRKTFFNN